MAVLKPVDSRAGGGGRSGIALDLGDLRREAEGLVARAQNEARGIIEEARVERERIIGDAAEVGHKEGRERGLAEGRDTGEQAGRREAIERAESEIAALAGSWERALEEFNGERERLLDDARRDVLTLAGQIAGRVVKRVIELEGDVVADQLAEALGLVMRPTRLVVATHPDDRVVAEAVLPSLLSRFERDIHAAIVDDESVGRGGCIVRTTRGEIDAGIEGQLERMIAALFPEDASAPTEPGDE